MKYGWTILGCCCLLVLLGGAETAARAECASCHFCAVSNCGCLNCQLCSGGQCTSCVYCNVFSCNCSPCPAPFQSCLSGDVSAGAAAASATPRVSAADRKAIGASRGRRRFRDMDTNKDKAVSKTEFDKWVAANAEEVRAIAGGRSSDDLFADVDKDKNGRITIAESGCNSGT